MRGTSFASAQATRVTAQSWLDGDVTERSASERIYKLARAADSADKTARKAGESTHFVNRGDIEKIGGGRLPNPTHTRVMRRGSE